MRRRFDRVWHQLALLAAALATTAFAVPAMAQEPERIAPRVLIISGNPDTESIAGTALDAFRMARRKGWSPTIRLGPESTWLLDGRRAPRLEDKDSVAIEIARAVRGAPEGQPLLLFLTGHGNDEDLGPRTDPHTIEFSVSGGDNLTHRELLAALPTDRPVIVLGTYCYDGTLHGFAHQRPNIVTLSVGGYRTAAVYHPSRLDDEKFVLEYPMGFWRELTRAGDDKQYDIDGDRRTSPFEGWLAALAADPLNQARGNISSMAYVDRQLGVDQYSPRWGAEFTGSPAVVAAARTHPVLSARVQRDELRIPTTCRADRTNSNEACNKLVTFATGVRSYLAHTEDPDYIASSGLPRPVQELWQRTLTDWRDNGERRIADARALTTRRDALFVDQGRLDQTKRALEPRAETLSKRVDDINDWWEGLGEEGREEADNITEYAKRVREYRADEGKYNADVDVWRTAQRELRERFEQLRVDAQRQLDTVRYQYRLIRKLERAALFLQTETDQDKKDKFLALLAQEMSPLD